MKTVSFILSGELYAWQAPNGSYDKRLPVLSAWMSVCVCVSLTAPQTWSSWKSWQRVLKGFCWWEVAVERSSLSTHDPTPRSSQGYLHNILQQNPKRSTPTVRHNNKDVDWLGLAKVLCSIPHRKKSVKWAWRWDGMYFPKQGCVSMQNCPAALFWRRWQCHELYVLSCPTTDQSFESFTGESFLYWQGPNTVHGALR